MKKLFFAIFAMAITLTACGQNNNKNTEDDMKTLVACFSGLDRKDLAQQCGNARPQFSPRYHEGPEGC